MATPTPEPAPSETPSAGDAERGGGGGKDDGPEPTPEPSPGHSPDPDYEPEPDRKGHDGRPSDERRAWERRKLRPAPPNAGTGFHIKPSHVYYVSALVRDEQFALHKALNRLVDDADCRQAAGKGSGPDDFAEVYAKVAAKFLGVWSRAIRSVGGASFGLNETANNYRSAEWFSHGQYGPPPRREAPIGVGKADYGSLADIKWTGTGDGTDIPLIAAMGNFPDWLSEVIEPAIKEGLRLGKTHDITPGADTGDLRTIGNAWHAAGQAAETVAGRLTGHIGYLTDESNDEWQAAMNRFCQQIWGTTAWGAPRTRGGRQVLRNKQQPDDREWRTNEKIKPEDRRPVIEILDKTAKAVKKEFDAVARVADETRETTSRLGAEAGKATWRDLTTDLDWGELTRLTATLAFGEIVMTFRSHMDKESVDRAVDAYQKAFHTGADALRKLLPELEEAYHKAPTYKAEAARAQAYGARSLDEFKNRHRWTKKGDTEDGRYVIDLAGTEGINNSHTVNKHVGLTDEQLAMRLRDELKKTPTEYPEDRPPPKNGQEPTKWKYGQPKIGNASTFPDMDTAQKATQYNIDNNGEAIEEWLRSGPEPGKAEPFTSDSTPYGATGRNIDKEHLQKSDFPADKAETVHGVRTELVYDPDLDPPFTVLSSMPVK
ncbi:RNase A-like domain-containing protein [Streptomyces cacaoi]|uniref:RNase A-like domain-containing protein n=1 Tax=Streptomyces cacaoi TaxID=1898 RepID=UPI002622CB7D|nr:RNase A-like domain-containing protein [Streptomyces cacaoi]